MVPLDTGVINNNIIPMRSVAQATVDLSGSRDPNWVQDLKLLNLIPHQMRFSIEFVPFEDYQMLINYETIITIWPSLAYVPIDGIRSEFNHYSNNDAHVPYAGHDDQLPPITELLVNRLITNQCLIYQPQMRIN